MRFRCDNICLSATDKKVSLAGQGPMERMEEFVKDLPTPEESCPEDGFPVKYE